MHKYPYPPKVDTSLFTQPEENFSIKYGLPENVKFCSSCVISNQRPNSAIEFQHTDKTDKKTIHFNESDVCDACITAQRKKEINWEEREKELIELCNQYRKNNGEYDCIVSGSGGKDSFYQAHVLKYKYNMHPLTVTWAPHMYTDWGWKNFQSWIHAGFDNVLYTPNGRVHRLVTRLAVENLFHPFQPFILGQKSIAPQFGIKYDLPLIFYGENEAEYGNPVADGNSAVRSWEYFIAGNQDSIYLGGTSVADLEKYFDLKGHDLIPYLPVDPELMQQKKIEIHYLGYYLKWHPQSCYYYAVEHGGFQVSPERTQGTYSKYNSIDDKIDDFHYYTTYIKFGIGRATYDTAQEVRSGDITRDEGIALIKRFDGEFPDRFAEEIYQYLSVPEKEYPIASKMFDQPVMDHDYFIRLADLYRSPHLWKYEDNQWKLRHPIVALDSEKKSNGYIDQSAEKWVGNKA